MKNILLIGASSEAALSLYKNFNQQYNFIRLSREDSQSCVSNFDILDPSTYYTEELKYDGLVYFPGTINLKPFKSLKIEDFYNLSLTVKDIASVYDSLQTLITGEVISDYHCDGCDKKVDITKRSLISQTPNVLIVHLQRLLFDFDTFRNEKNN